VLVADDLQIGKNLVEGRGRQKGGRGVIGSGRRAAMAILSAASPVRGWMDDDRERWMMIHRVVVAAAATCALCLLLFFSFSFF
jgi:hypothetical protein